MSEPATPGAAAPRRRVTPFTVFGVVAGLAIAGALFEMLYWTATPGTSAGALGTTLGIVAAVVIFFGLALVAPPNE